MVIRLLQREDIELLNKSFNAAFSTSSVKINLSKKDFESRLYDKHQVNFGISAVALVNDMMVGFVLHTSNLYENILTAYNCGTGTIPGFRNQHIIRQLYDFLFTTFKTLAQERILLEVLEDNQQAINLYKKLGFITRRFFRCYKQVKLTKLKPSLDNIFPGNMEVLNQDFLQFEPSFIDSYNQLKRGKETILVAKKRNITVGYIAFQPYSGRISQVAVLPDYRLQGFGRALIYGVRKHSKKQLTIMNIPDGEYDFDVFLKHCGFENQLNQLEMEKVI